MIFYEKCGDQNLKQYGYHGIIEKNFLISEVKKWLFTITAFFLLKFQTRTNCTLKP